MVERWHAGAGETAELFWALAVLVWIVVLYRRLVKPADGEMARYSPAHG